MRLLGVLGEVDDLAVVVGRCLVHVLGANVLSRGVLRLLRHACDQRAVRVLVGISDQTSVARLSRVHADWSLRGRDVVQRSRQLVAILAEVVEMAAPFRVVLVREHVCEVRVLLQLKQGLFRRVRVPSGSHVLAQGKGVGVRGARVLQVLQVLLLRRLVAIRWRVKVRGGLDRSSRWGAGAILLIQSQLGESASSQAELLVAEAALCRGLLRGKKVRMLHVKICGGAVRLEGKATTLQLI